MKNVQELIAQLSQVFQSLKAGEIKHKDADTLANIAGKMINATKVQVEYYALRKEAPVIKFLENAAPDPHGDGTADGTGEQFR